MRIISGLIGPSSALVSVTTACSSLRFKSRRDNIDAAYSFTSSKGGRGILRVSFVHHVLFGAFADRDILSMCYLGHLSRACSSRGRDQVARYRRIGPTRINRIEFILLSVLLPLNL